LQILFSVSDGGVTQKLFRLDEIVSVVEELDGEGMAEGVGEMLLC